jgi:PAS domain S-box-containing protein
MRGSDTDFETPALMGFIPRERMVHIRRVIVASGVVVLIILLLGLRPETVGGSGVATTVSLLAVIALCVYMVLRKQQNLDLVTMTEFQSLLFAQAAAMGSRFLVFVRRDGSVEYLNDGAHALFTEEALRETSSFDRMLQKSGIGETDRERLMTAIIGLRREQVIFPLTQKNGETCEYVITVAPLPRPAGFLVVRGREYTGTRTGSAMMPETLRSTTPERIDHLLTHSGVPHYVVNEYGRFEYVNPAFEHALGYAPGEVLRSNLSLHHVLYQLRGQAVTEDFNLTEALDHVTLQRKEGALIPAAIKQVLIRDEQQKILGATGSIILASPAI